MSQPTALRTWLDQAWHEHADQPRAVADGLLQRAASLGDDADGAEALRLAEHVLLAHLADAPALAQLLAQAPAHAALAAARERSDWMLDILAERPASALPDSQRWRALHNLVMALVGLGRVAQGRSALFAEEAAALASPGNDALRGYAASANNIAGDLRTGVRGDAQRDALMLDAAHLARRAWEVAGTWLHVERADYQLALCHAVLGQGAHALVYAQACLARCEAEGADPVECFFAHAALVQAQRAGAAPAAALGHRQQMQLLLDAISDPPMRVHCGQILAGL